MKKQYSVSIVLTIGIYSKQCDKRYHVQILSMFEAIAQMFDSYTRKATCKSRFCYFVLGRPKTEIFLRQCNIIMATGKNIMINFSTSKLYNKSSVDDYENTKAKIWKRVFIVVSIGEIDHNERFHFPQYFYLLRVKVCK